MSKHDFEHIRPYSDAETASVAKSLSDSIDWLALLTPLIGADNAEEIAEAMPFMQSVQEFQDELTFPFLEALIEGATDGVTVGFDAETVEFALSETTLHLTNHKDIVLDPSLVNVARMGNGYSSTEIGIGDNLLSKKWIEDFNGKKIKTDVSDPRCICPIWYDIMNKKTNYTKNISVRILDKKYQRKNINSEMNFSIQE